MWTKFSNIKIQWLNKNQKAKDETTNAQLPNNAIGVMTTLMEIKLMPLKEMGKEDWWWVNFRSKP
jgi:hypothetical protein